jgi:aryl-alcohol dehydrogenase-like predicted oxidoreductase
MTTSFSRTLGRSGIKVSAMGLGCWAIGGPLWYNGTPSGWGEVDDAESIRAIHRGLDLGINFFDTSDVYGAGHSERILGKALAGRREQAVIATKVGNTFIEETRQFTGVNITPAYIREACEASLKRLGTDYIDVYQFHRGDHPIEQGAEEVRDTFDALLSEGKIRSYGWSTDFPDRARFFAEKPGCTAIQHQINVIEGSESILDVCEELNLASLNRGPLAMGILTGKFKAGEKLPDDDVRGKPDTEGYFVKGHANPEFVNKLEAIREVLTSGGRTLAQGALAWLWGRSEKTVPIPGFKTVAQVEENCGAMKFGPLTAEQLRQIDVILGR